MHCGVFPDSRVGSTCQFLGCHQCSARTVLSLDCVRIKLFSGCLILVVLGRPDITHSFSRDLNISHIFFSPPHGTEIKKLFIYLSRAVFFPWCSFGSELGWHHAVALLSPASSPHCHGVRHGVKVVASFLMLTLTAVLRSEPAEKVVRTLPAPVTKP